MIRRRDDENSPWCSSCVPHGHVAHSSGRAQDTDGHRRSARQVCLTIGRDFRTAQSPTVCQANHQLP